ncbi:type II toxin-antitoxin system PemK/MazF family toxin [endosymbiont GvMRE of Glomus versiforme]|uniref:type II toxin-antitoxin system PemK/MazF family toxin n=1 Tax=endosymbiont GvMRE of Glomus versiforme TaxID=2039283 RepID=UPI000EDBEBB4|nr:type II toxin-antitoxin system PemK/MazF family toxin [endosymbiont GvMRE of Glomus versiforme]RHZ35714.1 mRNA interferase [endosymbiont GvMRE of Glomus versiforme]
MSEKVPKQGEIWLVDFNRQKQKEANKIRPVLIMSNNWQNEFDKQAIVALITSKEEELTVVEPFEVLIESTSQNGLDRKSKILLHRLHAIDKGLRLIERKGKVDSKIWAQVWKSLWIVFTGRKLG